MSDFLYLDKTSKLHDLAGIGFNPKTDGFVDYAYDSVVDSKLVKNDLAKYDTLRKYLQAHLHHLLNVEPDVMTTAHLDMVFGQNIVNFSNYIAPGQKTPAIEITNILLESLTQDWLDLPIEQAFPYLQSKCTGVSFVFVPRTPRNHVFVI